jgi:hypothetical protein
MVLVDAETCSEHLQVIRSDIGPTLAKRSKDENPKRYSLRYSDLELRLPFQYLFNVRDSIS